MEEFFLTKDEFVQRYLEPMFEAYEDALEKWYKCTFCKSSIGVEPTSFALGFDPMTQQRKWCVLDWDGRFKGGENAVPQKEQIANSYPDMSMLKGWTRVRIQLSEDADKIHMRHLLCPMCTVKFKQDSPEFFEDEKNAQP